MLFDLGDKIKPARADSVQTVEVLKICAELRSDYADAAKVSTMFLNDFTACKIDG